MRVLFVSGSPGGGSLRSTSELAQRLQRRGHTAGVLHSGRGGRTRRYLHKRAGDLEARLAPRSAARVVSRVAGRVGRRTQPEATAGGVDHFSALLPQNALGPVLDDFRPDVVVASSIDRLAWRHIRSELRAAGIASVLYLREESSVGHITVSNAPPDLLVANADIHTVRLHELGFECITIPSVVELDRCLIESSRELVLFVNPIDISGVDIAFALVRERPDLQFAFAESWRLDAEQRAVVDEGLRDLPNAEFRPRVDEPRLVYADARILFAPYLTNGRPRVALEAQANGIPVLASDIPALREAVGPGGVFVDPTAPIAEWSAALTRMLEPACYEELERAARTYAARSEVDPEHITDRFERALEAVVADSPHASPSGASPSGVPRPGRIAPA